MASKVLKCLLLIFFIKSTSFGIVKAELVLPKNNIENIADQIENDVDTDAKISPKEDFRLTKLLDIRFGQKYENLHPDLREAIRSEVKKLSTGDNKISSPEKNDRSHSEKQAEDYLQNITGTINEMSFILDDIKCDINQMKENVSRLANQSLRNGGEEHLSNFNSMVGVDIKPFCQCSHDVRIAKNTEESHSRKYIPKNCKEIRDKGNNISGIYEIQPKMSAKPFMVLCDMDVREGGWTHIQKRIDGSQDFFLGWREYKFGFGDLTGEFWLGLENIYLLTGFEGTELLVEIIDRDQVKAYAHYKAFAIGPEVTGYPLKILSGFSGDAGDALTGHLGAKFTTKDFDQDANPSNCATMYSGAWWYTSCHSSNLNGKYLNVDLPVQYKFHGVHWSTFRSHEYCHAKARMLVRPSQS